jgi:hypothetical protein
MANTFQCGMCDERHFGYPAPFAMGRTCHRCADVIRMGGPLERNIRVYRALVVLANVKSTAYHLIHGSPVVKGLALRLKTMSLIRHDRVLRSEL